MESAQKKQLFVFIILCSSCVVHSVKMQVTLEYEGRIRHLVLSEHINGLEVKSELVETLDVQNLIDESTLPSLTITNFVKIHRLKVLNIPLETMPVITNVSEFDRMSINGTKIRIIPTSVNNSANPFRLQVTNNEIDTIEDGAFNSNLFKLIASCNRLTTFSHTWFRSPENLKILDLAGNRIQHLEEYAFRRLTTLNHLNLMYNRIWRIDSAAFGTRFRHLDISFNNISELSTGMFSGDNVSIDLLYMDYNKLGFLSENLMLKLRAGNISLDGNPWQCPCLTNIEHWMQHAKIKRLFLSARRDDPVCVVARNFGDVCVPHVDRELQQTYVTALPRMFSCLATPCGSCNLEFKVLYQRHHLQQETPNFYIPKTRKKSKKPGRDEALNYLLNLL